MTEAQQTQVYQFAAEFVQQGASSNTPIRKRMVSGNTNNADETYGTDGNLVNAIGPLGEQIYRRKTASATALGATTTLTAAQSGTVIIGDRAAGIVVTLPPPQAGLWFGLDIATTVTSNAYKVITSSGSVFLIGSLNNTDTDTSNAVANWTADGSTILSVNMLPAGTNATGGMKGTSIEFHCISATLWMVKGFLMSAGTVATPFLNS